MASMTRRMHSSVLGPIRLLLFRRKLRKFLQTHCEGALGESLGQRGQASRSVQTSPNMCKIFEVPSRVEAKGLKQLYLNPKSLIDDLLQPLITSGVTVAPQLALTPRQGGRFWRAKLHLQWPSNVIVSAVHTSVTGAEENAYLLACDLFKNIGLLYQPSLGSMTPVSQDYILTVLHTLHSCSWHPLSAQSPQFHITTVPAHVSSYQRSLTACSSPNDANKDRLDQVWRTNIVTSWPYSFDVCALGPSSQVSQYAAALHTSIKLKTLGLLSNNNRLAESRLPHISRRFRSQAWTEATVCREQFDPHYEIYSDASAFGFGAYLVNKDDDRVRWLANTWSEHFPDSPQIIRGPREGTVSNSVFLESTFCELYSVVTACFTWKHKFVGKRVLVWTDSLSTVHLVNWGVQGETKQKRWGKLFCILAATCQKYSIELQASHVQRTDNIAADLLSRSRLAAFKEVVPEAVPSQKKTKKLLFWNPLQSVNISAELHHKFS